MLLVVFVIGITLLIFSVLFMFFPSALDDLSNWTSQVIVNVESRITKSRIPMGIVLFILGVLLVWLSLTTRF